VIKFVSDLRQLGGIHWVLWFPPPIKLVAIGIDCIGSYKSNDHMIMAMTVPHLSLKELKSLHVLTLTKSPPCTIKSFITLKNNKKIGTVNPALKGTSI
jgi:hypothetical protein